MVLRKKTVQNSYPSVFPYCRVTIFYLLQQQFLLPYLYTVENTHTQVMYSLGLS